MCFEAGGENSDLNLSNEAVLILPGFLSGANAYRELTDNLRDIGFRAGNNGIGTTRMLKLLRHRRLMDIIVRHGTS